MSMQSLEAIPQAIKFSQTANISKASKIESLGQNSLDLFGYFT